MVILLIRNLFLLVLGLSLVAQMEYVWFIANYIPEEHYKKLSLALSGLGLLEVLLYTFKHRYKGVASVFLYLQLTYVDFIITLGSLAIVYGNIQDNDELGMIYSIILAIIFILSLITRLRKKKEILRAVKSKESSTINVVE